MRLGRICTVIYWVGEKWIGHRVEIGQGGDFPWQKKTPLAKLAGACCKIWRADQAFFFGSFVLPFPFLGASAILLATSKRVLPLPSNLPVTATAILSPPQILL